MWRVVVFTIYSIRLDLLLRIQDRDRNNSVLKKRVSIAEMRKRDEFWVLWAKAMHVEPQHSKHLKHISYNAEHFRASLIAHVIHR
jgi:hypothetical protein